MAGQYPPANPQFSDRLRAPVYAVVRFAPYAVLEIYKDPSAHDVHGSPGVAVAT